MKYTIGGSSEDFYRLSSNRNTDEELQKYFITPSSSALEIMIGDESCIGNCSLSIDLLKQNFSYCSVHAPEYAYHKDDPKSHTILKYLDELCQRYPIQNVVVHPRKVKDRDIFLQYPNLPISIENMDDKKPSHKTPEDIGKILEKYPFGFTLDLQHCFVNDCTMKLAHDFHIAFGDRIKEYHISGFKEGYPHYTLFKAKQNQIIKALEKTNIPIIIESTFDSSDDLEKEIKYILQYLPS